MKTLNSNIEKIKKLLSQGNMYEAITQALSVASTVSEYTKTLAYPGIKEEVENIKEDYERMLLFFSDGMRDPDKESIYNRYSQNLLKIVRNMELMYLINTYSVYSAAFKRTVNFDSTLIAAKLEHFTEKLKKIAQEDQSSSSLKDFYKQKADYDNLLFSYILISPQWSEYEENLYLDLIVSPKTDGITSALMVSAIMLSCMSVYDFRKFSCLVQIYQRTSNAVVKERALVGWTLSLQGALMQSEKDRQKELVNQLCESDSDAIVELAELQKQLLFSLDTPKQSENFRKNMDQLIKESKFGEKIMKDDWEGADLDDSSFLDDEQRMETAEKYFDKIKNMEKSGFDVYFDGFSKMKNFAFFHTFSNWFLPYYFENPALHGEQNALDESSIAAINKVMTSRANICDSDKYSMAFAIGMTVKKTPELTNMFSRMATDVASLDGQEVVASPLMIRRRYLQSLYRFSKLCTMNAYLDDPFDERNKSLTFFLCRREFDTELFEKAKLSICRYLAKQKDYGRLGEFLYACSQTHHVDYMMMKALFEFYHEHDYASALHCVTSVLLKNPNSIPALKLMGRCYYSMENYEEAANVYERLIQMDGSSDAFKVHLACCLLEAGEINEGVQLLFEQEYHHPDKKEILRALAWGLMQKGQLDKAFDYYTRLARVTVGDDEQERAEDLYYMGLVCFCQHQIKQAVSYFAQFLQISKSESLSDKLRQDEHFMTKFDLSLVDIRLIEDAVKLSLNKHSK